MANRFGGDLWMMMRHIIFKIFLVAVGVIAAFAVVLIFFFDSFTVKGDSMEPTFHNGQRIYVNKLLMGARIYRNYDFSSTKLSSFRMPGLRKLSVGDIVIFNYPFVCSKDTIGFKINYVYAKRCLGAPGDSVRIKDGFYRDEEGRIVGESEYQYRLHNIPDSSLMKVKGCYYAMNGWNVKCFGPIYVPGKGDKVTIGETDFLWYRKLIKYETGFMPAIDSQGQVSLDGKILKEYTFKGNWYFLGGDNVLNSRDSRYFGLVPEEYIVGIVIQ